MEISQLQGFVLAYQQTQPLTMGELWALPLMVRLSLLEQLAQGVRDLLQRETTGDVSQAPAPGVSSRRCIHRISPLAAFDGDGIAVRAGGEVEHAVDHQRRGLQVEVGRASEVFRLEPPGHFQLVRVGGVDLVVGRVAGDPQIAAPGAPLAVLRGWTAPKRRVDGGKKEPTIGPGQERAENAPHGPSKIIGERCTEAWFCWVACVVVFVCAFRLASSFWYCSSVRKAMSVQPWPISSIVRLPQPRQFVGSGLCRLLVVLSCHDVVWRMVPAGNRCGVLYE